MLRFFFFKKLNPCSNWLYLYAAHMRKMEGKYEIKTCENTCDKNGSKFGLGLFFILNHTLVAIDSHTRSSPP